MSTNELQHYGVYGMHWGERRYQNPDGSLTEAGKARYAQVASSASVSRRHTRQAIREMGRNARTHGFQAERLEKKSEKFSRKATEANNELDKKMYSNKANDAAEMSKIHRKLSDYSSKKMTDISVGDLKAGRDFIVQHDLMLYPLYIPGVAVGLGWRDDKNVIVKGEANPYIYNNGKAIRR